MNKLIDELATVALAQKLDRHFRKR